MGKFARAWELTKQSGRVLLSDKQLLILPILSSIACILVLATFAVPMILMVDWSAITNSSGTEEFVARMGPLQYVLLFLFYFANFFVITFFNTALVGCAIRKFKGESASLGDGLRLAASRLPQIAAWALVAATIGIILKAIEERAGFIGKIVLNLIGMAWAIATFFVVPVLVVEKVGPFTAIKRSVEILKKTWGEALIANLGLGAVFGILTILGILILGGGGVALAIAMSSFWPAAICGALLIVFLVGVALVSETLKGIILAATYQYAATGSVPSGFDQDLLSQAFKQKKAKA